jgi:hypothetical protein
MDRRIPDSNNLSRLLVWPKTGGNFSWILRNFQILEQNSSIFSYFEENTEKVFWVQIFFNLRLSWRFEKSIFYFRA